MRQRASWRTWTAQQARNLIMDLGDQADRVKFMIRDRAGIRTALCCIRRTILTSCRPFIIVDLTHPQPFTHCPSAGG